MIYFLNIMLTWKIMRVSEASVLYIYIYIYRLCLVAKKFSSLCFIELTYFYYYYFLIIQQLGEEKFEHCISSLEKPKINN